MPKKYFIEAGMRFDLLVTVEATKKNNGRGHKWLCICDCGGTRIVSAGNLMAPGRKGCGCLKGASNVKHGMSRSKEYKTWDRMRYRCHNPNSPNYKQYGAKGISVCQRWAAGEHGKTGFECFFEDMGHAPSKQHTLDRVDNTKGYSKDNCRWATYTEQNRNRNFNVIVKLNGKSMTLAEASERSGVCHSTLASRIKHGWPEERLFDAPQGN